MVQVNEIAFLKVTGEAVFVMSLERAGPKTLVTVRRPVFSQANGITHLVENFLLEELEDETDRQKREQKQFLSLKDQVQAELDRQCQVEVVTQPLPISKAVN